MALTNQFSLSVDYFNYRDTPVLLRFNNGINVTVKPSEEEACLNTNHRDKLILQLSFKTTDAREIRFSDNPPPKELDRYIIKLLKDTIAETMEARGFYGIAPIIERQYQIVIDLNSNNEFSVVSDLLGVEITLEDELIERFNVANTAVFIKEFEQLENGTKEFSNKETRTIAGIKLIDRKGKVGKLWTTIFGKVCQIEAITTSGLEDGLYILAGKNFERVTVYSLDELTESFLKENNLHFSRMEAISGCTNKVVQDQLKDYQNIKGKLKEANSKVEKLENDIAEQKRIANVVKANHEFEIMDLKQKQWNEVSNLNNKINDLRTEKAALADDNKQLKREYKEDLNIERQKNEKRLSELKDSQKTNTILDVLKSIAAVAGVFLTLFKFIKT